MFSVFAHATAVQWEAVLRRIFEMKIKFYMRCPHLITTLLLASYGDSV